MSDQLHRTRTLWLCTGLHMFTHIYQVALIPLYFLIRKDLHLADDAQATFLVSAMGLAYFIPAYPMGLMADRFNRKKLLATGLAINALGYVCLALSHSYAAVVASVMLAGFGGSFYHPAATALLARLFPEGPGKALGLSGIGASVGLFLAPIFSGWRGESAGWRAPVRELGLWGLVGAGLFLWLAHDHTRPASENEKARPREGIFPSPLLWIFFFAAALCFSMRDFAGNSMLSLGSLFLQAARHLDAKTTGLTLGSLYLASVISNPVFGGLSDRGRIRWTAAVLVTTALIVAVFPRLPTEWCLPALVVYGFFIMASYPMVEAAVMEAVHDSVRGRVFGMFITVGGLVSSWAHWWAGHWVGDLGAGADLPENYFGVYLVLALLLLLSMLGLACLHGIRRRERPVESARVL